MNRIIRPFILSSLLVAPLTGPQAVGADEAKNVVPSEGNLRKPNILIILADDLGYGDVQCYNPEHGKIPTPNMDRLAAQGLRFTDGHSSAGACTPSRYSILTGRYDWRSRLQRGVLGGFGTPLIPPSRLTIASLAKEGGYRTACIGKWHIGMNWPIEKGDDKFLGLETLEQIEKEAEKTNETPTPSVEKLAVDGFYTAQPIAGYKTPVPTAEQLAVWRKIFSQPITGGPTAVGFDHYFGMDVPGYPPYCFIENDRTVGVPSQFLSAKDILPAAMLGEWQGPTVKDWDFYAAMPTLIKHTGAYLTESAKSKDPFLLYLALPAPHQPWAVTEPMRKKSGLSLYCDWVMETDAAIGQVLESLDKSGAANNTLVILCSDNGYSPYGIGELIKKGHYSSGPFRGCKAEAYEGGHREPFIVRWPGVVKPGTVCSQTVCQVDIMATMADIFGVRLPENAGEDSFSFLPLLKGQDKPIRPNLVNHSGQGGYGIRCGDWKLILEVDKKDRRPVQLFNLAEDIGEKKDLADQYPERVAEMRALMEKLVANGRSTPGAKQKNDAEVRWLPKKL
ncbi:MAG: arylsulfatase [Verrucomicrobiota bacterium]